MIFAAGLAFMLMGCDSGQPTPATDEHVWSAQTRALDAAKDVDQAVQESAQARDRAIDEQSQ
jgi:hypothetical protein